MRQILFISMCLLFLSGTSLYAQECDDYEAYCDIEYFDYDYDSQSAFTLASPGDTIPFKIVLYGRKNYHITVCSELGDLKWKMVHPIRKTVRKIEEIRKDTNIVYKTDEYGDNIFDDETGDYVVESMDVTVDTVWSSKRVADEEFIFDNSKEKEWVQKLKKTQRVFIYVIVPAEVDPEGGCVAVMIGSESSRKAKFKRR